MPLQEGVQHTAHTVYTVLRFMLLRTEPRFKSGNVSFIIFIGVVLSSLAVWNGVIYVYRVLPRLPRVTVLPHVTVFLFYLNQVDVPCIPGSPEINK